MTEINHQPCPHTSCGSRDAFSWNTEKLCGFCYSCGQPYPMKRMDVFDWANERYSLKRATTTTDSKWDEDEEDEPYMTKTNLKVVDDGDDTGYYMPLRGILKGTMEFFGVKTYDRDGEPNNHTYPYPNGLNKTRIFPKSFHVDNGFRGDMLFGMDKFPAGSAQAVTITEGECFPETAEVLTPSGWKALKDLYDTDNVMQIEQDGVGRWVKPKVIIDKTYTGDLIEYSSGSFYSLTTPDHNIVRNHPKSGYVKYPAKQNSYFTVPRTADLQGWCGYSLEELQVWIMLSADFTFRKAGDIYGAFKKVRKVERAKQLLIKMGVRFSCNKVSNGYYSIFIHRGHNLSFAQKDLPWSMVWSANKKQLLEELIFWDGNYVKGKNQAEFSTNRKHNADVAQALSHSCGYVSSIIHRTNTHGSWMKVSILFNKTSSSTQKGYKSVPFSGRVMCVQVDSGMILVRQGGSISISGNCDAMSAFQMLGSKYPTVSLPSATPSKKLLENCKDWLGSFEKIYLSLDADDKADKFALALMNLFPGRVYRVPHDKYKDANEFLQDGKSQLYKHCWYNAKLFTPDNIYSTEERFLELLHDTPEHSYVPTGIADLDEKILGLMRGHFTVIKGPTGIGKSELMRYLESNFILNYPKVRFATWHLEETKLRSLLGVVSYYLKDNLTRKDLIEQKGRMADVEQAIKEITTNTGYMQFHLREEDGAEALIDQIRVLTQVYGCEFVLLEPIQDVVTVGSDESKEAALAELAVRLSKLSADLNVGIITIAHTNEAGDVKYCKMIGQRASVIIDISRDKESDNLIDRNTTKLVIKKNRPTGLEGSAGELAFDPETFTLREKTDTW